MTASNIPSQAALAWSPDSSRPTLRLRDSTTFRNWIKAFAITLGIIGFVSLFYWFDKYQGWFEFQTRRLTEYRMLKNPTTMPMRIFGIPHFIIAMMFLMTSKRMQQRKNKLLLAGYTVLGVILCWLFKQAGGHTSAFAALVFYFYFLVHGFRDDAHFYKTYGDMPADGLAIHDRVIRVLLALQIGLLLSLFWPTYQHFSNIIYHKEDPVLSAVFPSDWPFAKKLFSMFAPMLAIAIFAMHRITRSIPDGWAGLWRTHRPILVVYLLSLGVLALAMLGGPGAFDIWVLNHFVVWYIFTIYLFNRRAAQNPQPTPTISQVGLWNWMRTTRRGFITLHNGMALVITAMMCVSVYAYGQKDSPFDWIVGKEAFYYWTILHVSWSWVPR